MKVISSALTAAAFAIPVFVTPGPATAAPITRTYVIGASGFSSQQFGAPPAPVAAWNSSFTVTFDPAANAGPAPVDSYVSQELNGGGYGPFSFVYDALNQRLFLGDNCPSSCTLSSSDALIQIALPTPDTPGTAVATYRVEHFDFPGDPIPDLFDYTAAVVTVSVAASSVPEPASLALLAIAVSALGIVRRRSARVAAGNDQRR